MSIEQLATYGMIRNEKHELVRKKKKKRDGFVVVDDRFLILVQKKEN